MAVEAQSLTGRERGHGRAVEVDWWEMLRGRRAAVGYFWEPLSVARLMTDRHRRWRPPTGRAGGLWPRHFRTKSSRDTL
jgi:hypothetical protein